MAQGVSRGEVVAHLVWRRASHVAHWWRFSFDLGCFTWRISSCAGRFMWRISCGAERLTWRSRGASRLAQFDVASHVAQEHSAGQYRHVAGWRIESHVVSGAVHPSVRRVALEGGPHHAARTDPHACVWEPTRRRSRGPGMGGRHSAPAPHRCRRPGPPLPTRPGRLCGLHPQNLAPPAGPPHHAALQVSLNPKPVCEAGPHHHAALQVSFRSPSSPTLTPCPFAYPLLQRSAVPVFPLSTLVVSLTPPPPSTLGGCRHSSLPLGRLADPPLG